MKLDLVICGPGGFDWFDWFGPPLYPFLVNGLPCSQLTLFRPIHHHALFLSLHSHTRSCYSPRFVVTAFPSLLLPYICNRPCSSLHSLSHCNAHSLLKLTTKTPNSLFVCPPLLAHPAFHHPQRSTPQAVKLPFSSVKDLLQIGLVHAVGRRACILVS